MGDRAGKLALVISVITLVLVVGGAFTAYSVVRGLVINQIDNAIFVLQDLKVRKFSIPIIIDRVIELPVNTSVPINLSTTVDFVFNESIQVPIAVKVPVEIPMNIPVETPVTDSLRINYSTISKSYVVIEGTTYELEIPINISTEVPITLEVRTTVNYTAKTLLNINATLPVTIYKDIKLPVNKSLEIPIVGTFKIPIRLEMTYVTSLKDLGLDAYVDRLISMLVEVRRRMP